MRVVLSAVENACALNHSLCQHICIAMAGGGHTCRCRHGYELQADRRSCKGQARGHAGVGWAGDHVTVRREAMYRSGGKSCKCQKGGHVKVRWVR